MSELKWEKGKGGGGKAGQGVRCECYGLLISNRVSPEPLDQEVQLEPRRERRKWR